MNVEIPLNLTSSNRDLIDIIWEWDENNLTAYNSPVTISVDVDRYMAFDIIAVQLVDQYITDGHRIIVINDPSVSYEYVIGGNDAGDYYRSVKLVNGELIFGEIYVRGAVYNPSTTGSLAICTPYRIYGIR